MNEPHAKARTATEVLQQLADLAATDLTDIALGARLERLLLTRAQLHVGLSHDASRTSPDGGQLDDEAGTARARPCFEDEALNDGELAAVAYADALLQQGDSPSTDSTLEELMSHFDKAAVRDMTAVVLRAEVQYRLSIARLAGPDLELADLSPAEHHAATEPDRADGMGSIICPRCGHELSMFMETPESRANRAAQRLADALASWRFIALLILVTVVFVVFALAVEPFGTDTAIVLNYLGIGMTTLVAIQTPLILLTQRRDAARDRARDQEALRVATQTEYDLHALRNALEGRRD